MFNLKGHLYNKPYARDITTLVSRSVRIKRANTIDDILTMVASC